MSYLKYLMSFSASEGRIERQAELFTRPSISTYPEVLSQACSNLLICAPTPIPESGDNPIPAYHASKASPFDVATRISTPDLEQRHPDN